MWKKNSSTTPSILVVVGAHRNELAFGQLVADELDPELFSVLRIPHGISGERPLPDQFARFQEHHHSLYLQILEHVKPEHRLLIDLHQGVDSGMLCADVLCADQTLLDQVCANAGREKEQLGHVRCIRLVSDTTLGTMPLEESEPPLVARPIIPESVWNDRNLLYIGIEIYLSTEGNGTVDEQNFARNLIRQIGSYGLAAKR
jgi:hypothetical protein